MGLVLEYSAEAELFGLSKNSRGFTCDSGLRRGVAATRAR